MRKINDDIPEFLEAIDLLAENLHASKRPEDAGAPACTPRQLSALNAISRNGHLKMSELATFIEVPLSTATRIVDQLVAKNLLKREASSQDARVIEVGFSVLGDEINDYIDHSRKEKAVTTLSALSTKERALFLRQLKQLSNN